MLYFCFVFLAALNDFVQGHAANHGGDEDYYRYMAGSERSHGWSRAESSQAPANTEES